MIATFIANVFSSFLSPVQSRAHGLESVSLGNKMCDVVASHWRLPGNPERCDDAVWDETGRDWGRQRKGDRKRERETGCRHFGRCTTHRVFSARSTLASSSGRARRRRSSLWRFSFSYVSLPFGSGPRATESISRRMRDKMSCVSGCIKWLLFIFNLLFVVSKWQSIFVRLPTDLIAGSVLQLYLLVQLNSFQPLTRSL